MKCEGVVESRSTREQRLGGRKRKKKALPFDFFLSLSLSFALLCSPAAPRREERLGGIVVFAQRRRKERRTERRVGEAKAIPENRSLGFLRRVFASQVMESRRSERKKKTRRPSLFSQNEKELPRLSVPFLAFFLLGPLLHSCDPRCYAPSQRAPSPARPRRRRRPQRRRRRQRLRASSSALRRLCSPRRAPTPRAPATTTRTTASPPECPRSS